MRARPLPLLVALCALHAPSRQACAAERAEVLTLANGLVVVLQRVKESDQVAVAVVSRVGRADDPEGQEGRAEVLARLFALSKAGPVPERGPEALQRVDKQGLRAYLSVGRERSVLAQRSAPEDLPALVEEAAARLSALAPSEVLLGQVKTFLHERREAVTRKVPREASARAARLAAAPEPGANGPFGTADGVDALTLADLVALLPSVYAPRRTVVAIAGAFDLAKARALVKRTLAPLATGPEAPAAAPRTPPEPAPDQVVSVPTQGRQEQGREAALVIAGPRSLEPASQAAWLVLAARLCESVAPQADPSPSSVECYPLQEPGLIVLRRRLKDGEDDAAALRPLRSALEAARAGAASAKDLLAVRKQFQHLLGLPQLEGAQGDDLVGTAAGLGLAQSLACDPAALLEAVKKVRAEDLRAQATASVVRGAVTHPD